MIKYILPCVLTANLLCSCRAPIRPTPPSHPTPPVVPAPVTPPSKAPGHTLQFTVFDFSAVRGFKDVGISAINNKGQAVGRAIRMNGPTMFHAFLFSNGEGHDLGSLGGGESQATAINDAGEVAGEGGTPDGSQHAFLWRHRRMKDIGALGRSAGRVIALNNQGQVIGTIDEGVRRPNHSFIYSGGRMHDLGASFAALAINDAGRILGLKDGHLCLLWRGRIKPLPIQAKHFPIVGDAAVMNNRGQIAYTTDQFGGADEGHPWLYAHHTRYDLGKLVPHSPSRAAAINDRSEVVGAVVGPGGDWGAILWKNRQAYDLGYSDDVTLTPRLPGSFGLMSAYGINNRGQILVEASNGISADAERRSYLLTPKK